MPLETAASLVAAVAAVRVAAQRINPANLYALWLCGRNRRAVAKLHSRAIDHVHDAAFGELEIEYEECHEGLRLRLRMHQRKALP
jgi:hypothetical protein